MNKTRRKINKRRKTIRRLVKKRTGRRIIGGGGSSHSSDSYERISSLSSKNSWNRAMNEPLPLIPEQFPVPYPRSVPEIPPPLPAKPPSLNELLNTKPRGRNRPRLSTPRSSTEKLSTGRPNKPRGVNPQPRPRLSTPRGSTESLSPGRPAKTKKNQVGINPFAPGFFPSQKKTKKNNEWFGNNDNFLNLVGKPALYRNGTEFKPPLLIPSTNVSSPKPVIPPRKGRAKSNSLPPPRELIYTPALLSKPPMILFDNSGLNNHVRDFSIKPYKHITTLMNGDCFYSAYYRMARMFNSSANLALFPQLNDSIEDEERWISQFKNYFFGFMANSSTEDTNIDLFSAVNDWFYGIVRIILETYMLNPKTKPNEYLPFYEKNKLIRDSYSNDDQQWIDIFTITLPEKLSQNETSFKHIFNIYNKVSEVSKSRIINRLITHNENFIPIITDIRNSVLDRLWQKNNPPLKTNQQKKSSAYATDAEISIIIKYIKNIAKQNPTIIPIKDTILSVPFNETEQADLANVLDGDQAKIQFIMYKNGLHYEGLYSEDARERYLEQLTEYNK